MHCRRPLLHRRLPQRAAQAAEISYVIAVPNSEPIICAVIATALFGGELRLMPPEQGDLPVAEYVFEVKVPDGGDRPANDFERAAYITLFPNDPDTPDISTLDGPLSIAQREKLAARLRTIKRVRRASLAFVVRADFSADGSNGFAASHQVPVMVPESEATSKLLGMNVNTLLAEIREFWASLKVILGKSSPVHPPSTMPQPSGGSAMPPSGPVFNIGTVSGGLAVAAGSHSAAQSGTGHTANIDHREGADLAALVPLLQELGKEIGQLSSAEKRGELTAHVELAQHEAVKKDTPDPGRIKRALDVIESGAEGLEHSGKILALCNKAYNLSAPFLGLPQSPVP